MTKALRLTTLWLWGGFIYFLVEVLWRGHSHPSMFVVGGICFLLIGGINNWLPWKMGMVYQALIGAGVVTAVEFVAGVILNIWLGLEVWDYSAMPMNVLGQICLPYCLAWVGLSVVAVFLDDCLRWKLYGEQRPTYSIWGKPNGERHTKEGG